MSVPHETVESHYGKQGLFDTIYSAFRAAGQDPDRLTYEDLKLVDEFHIRSCGSQRLIPREPLVS